MTADAMNCGSAYRPRLVLPGWYRGAARRAARQELARIAAQREAEKLREPVSLLNPRGDVLLTSLFPPPAASTAAAQAPRLNLAPEQVTELLDSQADALVVVGFPPTVSVAAAPGGEMDTYKQLLAASAVDE